MSSVPPRVFVDHQPRAGDRIRLDAAEARHVRVRRLQRGERVELFDGRGHVYVGIIEQLTPRTVEIGVTEQRADDCRESTLVLTLAIALLKADRLEWVIEKATELGVSRVRTFVSRFSLAQPSAARRARWHQIAVSAAKQCGRSIVPAIDDPVAYELLLAQTGGHRLMLWERAGAAPELDPPASGQPITLIVGPEGGFSESEVSAARAHGCHVIGLGPRTLRADTAAIAAVALCQWRWGDLAPSAPWLVARDS